MRGFVRRAAREMQGQGCQSAGGYNKGPGVERPIQNSLGAENFGVIF